MNKDQLIELISKSFQNVSREDGVSLREGIVLDECGTAEERARARTEDTENHWSEISDNDLIKYSDALCFFDKKSFKYYAPAYMIYCLKNHAHSDAFCIDSIVYAFNCSQDESLLEYHLDRYSQLSTAQNIAIAQFLTFIAHSNDDDLEVDHARAALDYYWEKFLKMDA